MTCSSSFACTLMIQTSDNPRAELVQSGQQISLPLAKSELAFADRASGARAVEKRRRCVCDITHIFTRRSGHKSLALDDTYRCRQHTAIQAIHSRARARAIVLVAALPKAVNRLIQCDSPPQIPREFLFFNSKKVSWHVPIVARPQAVMEQYLVMVGRWCWWCENSEN
jgi:hypothetical protein